MNDSTMNRYPIAPKHFLNRVKLFSLGLAVVQFIHLSIFADARFEDFAMWFAVHTIIQSSLWMLRIAARHSVSYMNIYWLPLVTLLILSFVTKIYSRIPYMSSWFAEGLYGTRANMDLGVSGVASYFNIFFYPLAIILAFTILPKRSYLVAISCVIIMCLIDLVFIGTRNAPVFVLLFHFLSAPASYKPTMKSIGIMVLVVVVFTGIFSYSTIHRSYDSIEGSFDWLTIFEKTGSAQILKINRNVVEPLSEYVPAVLPAIFLSHYVSHSIGEMAHLLEIRNEMSFGNLVYLADQFAGIGLGSRQYTDWAIESANPRAGVYQTIFSSLFFDFGIAGAVLLWLILLLLISLWHLLRPNHMSLGVILSSVVIAVGPIENYLYNGLGLAQVLTLFLALFMVQILGRLVELIPKSTFLKTACTQGSKKTYAHTVC